jgi:hypothetical protein
MHSPEYCCPASSHGLGEIGLLHSNRRHRKCWELIQNVYLLGTCGVIRCWHNTVLLRLKLIAEVTDSDNMLGMLGVGLNFGT